MALAVARWQSACCVCGRSQIRYLATSRPRRAPWHSGRHHFSSRARRHSAVTCARGLDMDHESSDRHGAEVEPLLQRHSSSRAPLDVESSQSGSEGRLSADGTHTAAHDADRKAVRGARWCLMGSYALAAWAWRSWEFAVALLLIDLFPTSLRLVAAYGIVDNVVRILLGSRVGALISRRELVPAATGMYLAQNACIGASSACALLLLMPGVQDQGSFTAPVRWALVTVMVLAGALSSVGSSGVRIAVEVQAVAALGAGDAALLSRMNAGFRAIDLTCLLAAPLLVGVVMTWAGPAAATLLLGGYALCAWIPELSLLRVAVASSPRLRESRRKQQPPAPAVAMDADSSQAPDHEGPLPAPPPAPPQTKHGLLSDLAVYCRQPVLLPQLALGCLYCTVLSLGFLMTSYLQWGGMSSAEVSVYRGFGAVAGLAATWIFPLAVSKLGPMRSAWLGSAYQLAWLAGGVVPIIVAAVAHSGGLLHPTQPGPDLTRLLVVAVAASRTGLWLFDLGVTQLVQLHVAPSELGIVSGVQTSLQAGFEMASFMAGLALHDPTQFAWLMVGSLAFVATAFVLMSMFVIREFSS